MLIEPGYDHKNTYRSGEEKNEEADRMQVVLAMYEVSKVRTHAKCGAEGYKCLSREHLYAT